MRCIYDCQGSGGGQGAIDPHFSPDAKWVAFVRGEQAADRERAAGPGGGQGGDVCWCYRGSGSEVFAVPVEGEGLHQLTFGAEEEEGRTNGVADFVAQEEMDRYSGTRQAAEPLLAAKGEAG